MNGIPRASSLSEATRTLVDTALGRSEADLVITNSNFVNVNSGELQEDIDIAVKVGRVGLVGRADHTIGDNTTVFDASGKYVCPGLIDAHVHIESSMITTTQFANAVLPFGTTACFVDPHEIANVLGLEGVRLMLDEGRNLPLKVFVTMPSCVPAGPGFETSGAVFGAEEVREAMSWDGVVALGEMMNYPGVLAGDKNVHEEIAATLEAGKIVEGHDASLLDKELSAYAAAGITSSHESVRKIDAIQRLRNGMYAFLREGSAWLDVEETVKSVTEAHLDPRHVSLVTDDKEPDSIVKEGHVNHSVRRAIEEGVDPVTAIQMATLNPAEHYEMAREIGSVAPSRIADILVLDSLTRMEVDRVFVNGLLVARDGRMVAPLESPSYPEYARKSVHLHRPLVSEDFLVRTERGSDEVEARVIGAIEGSVNTRNLVEGLPVREGVVQPDPDRAILRTAVVERHKSTGNIGLGFTKGFQLSGASVATTVAHDSHNILILGVDPEDMALAGNKLAGMGGGIITIRNGELMSSVELPVAGLMSTEPVETVARRVEEMYRVWRELGCSWVSPFMTMSLLALSVLPELRLTDLGLVDTVDFRFVDLLVD